MAESEPLPGGWERPRPPVLGHALERDPVRDIWRLVVDADPPRVLATGSPDACAGALIRALEGRHGKGLPNLPLRTLGAKQFWGDRFTCGGWRIQENVLTGHCRLLDPDDVRRAWGGWEACRTAFERERREREIRPASPHWVILLHGMGRSKAMASRMAAAVRTAGLEPVPVSYPSTRRSIEDHASALCRLLNAAEDCGRVSFITHSLGGIVVREALARGGPWTSRIVPGRLVMVAPPSRGSRLAEALKDFLPYVWLLGETGQGLTPERVARVPLPAIPFGIIAGGKGGGKGYNPLLPGDDDGVVALEETRLEGAADFLRVEGLHTFLFRHRGVIRAAVRFIETGRFQEPPGDGP